MLTTRVQIPVGLPLHAIYRREFEQMFFLLIKKICAVTRTLTCYIYTGGQFNGKTKDFGSLAMSSILVPPPIERKETNHAHNKIGLSGSIIPNMEVKEKKIYGNTITKTFVSYEASNRNFGIILSGAGKILFVQKPSELCLSHDLPIIIVDSYYNGLADFEMFNNTSYFFKGSILTS